ncbi:MAG: ABC transporter substrate-binding protein [Chloroflexota bacterium]
MKPLRKYLPLLGALLLVLAVVLSGCQQAAPAATTPAPAATAAPTAAATKAATAAVATKPANPEVILATTTSTRDSGLLDVLLPDFQRRTGYTVKPIAVGSGQAMTLGERGEADVLLVHAPDSEKTFMANGHGTKDLLVMHNDFVVLGPKSDPAAVKGKKTTAEGLKAIADKKALFVSRGDNSGTDQLEKKLWKGLGIEPKGQTWYQETGQGMGEVLRVSSEKDAYTIADRATWLSQQKTLALQIVLEGDPTLLNIYSVIPVDPKKNDKINAAGGEAFAQYMVSPEAQALIKTYGVEKYGGQLFFPDAGKTEAEVGR